MAMRIRIITKQPTYWAMHSRIRDRRGPARTYACFFDCGRQAKQWALRHEAKNLLTGKADTRGCRAKYSTNIDDYIPLCATCHVRYDLLKEGSAA